MLNGSLVEFEPGSEPVRQRLVELSTRGSENAARFDDLAEVIAVFARLNG